MKTRYACFAITGLIFVLVFLLCFNTRGIVKTQSIGFYEPFDTFNEKYWLKSSHTLGRTALLPENVFVKDDLLHIKLPSETLSGGEIESVNYYGYGTYTARLKLPYAPSSITGFFLYRSPDLHHEIDIEIYNDSSRRIMFTTYAGGRQTHTVTKELPFDPTRDFHEYCIIYKKNRVEFYIDGNLFQAWSGGITNQPMKLLLNAWYPTWLDGIPPTTDQYLLVDWISITQ